jgi:hypothetical protein
MSQMKSKGTDGNVQEQSQLLPVSDLSVLMIAIFQMAHPIYRNKVEPLGQTEYLAHCASDIDELGRIFKFLGLAEDSAQSAFGWRPTARLVRIIAERAARPTKGSDTRATKKERQLVDSLLQLAGKQTEEILPDEFLFNVLNGLGLLRGSVGGECKPTTLLKEVVQDMLAA